MNIYEPSLFTFFTTQLNKKEGSEVLSLSTNFHT